MVRQNSTGINTIPYFRPAQCLCPQGADLLQELEKRVVDDNSQSRGSGGASDYSYLLGRGQKHRMTGKRVISGDVVWGKDE